MATGKDGELARRILRAVCHTILAELDRDERDTQRAPRIRTAPVLPTEVDQKAAQNATLDLSRAGLVSAHGKTTRNR